jgi:hypothetical protein
MAELVAAVVRGPRLHAVEHGVAAEHLRELRRSHVVLVEPEARRHLARMRDQPRCGDRRRVDARPGRSFHLAQARAGFGIARQFAQEGVVEMECIEHGVLRKPARLSAPWMDGSIRFREARLRHARAANPGPWLADR